MMFYTDGDPIGSRRLHQYCTVILKVSSLLICRNFYYYSVIIVEREKKTPYR